MIDAVATVNEHVAAATTADDCRTVILVEAADDQFGVANDHVRAAM